MPGKPFTYVIFASCISVLHRSIIFVIMNKDQKHQKATRKINYLQCSLQEIIRVDIFVHILLDGKLKEKKDIPKMVPLKELSH